MSSESIVHVDDVGYLVTPSNFVMTNNQYRVYRPHEHGGWEFVGHLTVPWAETVQDQSFVDTLKDRVIEAVRSGTLSTE